MFFFQEVSFIRFYMVLWLSIPDWFYVFFFLKYIYIYIMHNLEGDSWV